MILSGTAILLGCLVYWSVLDAYLYALLSPLLECPCAAAAYAARISAPLQISSRMVGVVRYMHELELEAVGVGEEHRVVAWFIAVLRWRIQDHHAPLD